MAQKTFNTRIQHKHDVEANWNLATNFIPLAGELIVYDVDATYDYARFKVGDGSTKLSDLPFVGTSWDDIIDKPSVEGLATTEYVDSKIVQPDWDQTDETKPDYIKNKPVLNSNYIVLIDQINGYEYLVQMMGGNLVSFCKTASIEVITPPTKAGYFEGEDIDLTGMMLMAICPDGSNRQIENYDYSPKVMAADTTQIDIVYEEGGVTYTTSTQVTLKTVAEMLVDFEYTENADGTYTLTEWKEVVDGVARTELIVPDNDKIIV